MLNIMTKNPSSIYNLIAGIIGLVAGIILLTAKQWIWGIVAIIAGGYLSWNSYKKLRAEKPDKELEKD
jgi:threonine/homoserine/homoserine lactone efflux protein